MRDSDAASAPGQAGVAGKVRTEDAKAPAVPWRVCTPASFPDARTTHRRKDGSPISVRERLTLQILDGYCRNRPYCWVRNVELAAAYGCEERGMLKILAEMEADGLIARVMEETAKKGRVGIVMRKRADPTRPFADSESALRLAIASLKEQRERPSKSAVPRPSKSAPPRPSKSAPELRVVVVKEDEPEKDEPSGTGNSALERQRQEPDPTPEPAAGPPPDPGPPTTTTTLGSLPIGDLVKATDGDGAVDKERQFQEAKRKALEALAARGGAAPSEPAGSSPARPAPSRPAGPSKPAEPAPPEAAVPPPVAAIDMALLAAGMLEFLAKLSAEERAAFDALPAEERAKILEPHRAGYDRIAAAEDIRRLRPPPTLAPEPAPPETTADLWANLRDGPPHWPQLAANALARDFKDPQYWNAYHGLAMEVWKGVIDARKVVDAYRQAMKPETRDRGKMFCHALKCHRILWEGSRP